MSTNSILRVWSGSKHWERPADYFGVENHTEEYESEEEYEGLYELKIHQVLVIGRAVHSSNNTRFVANAMMTEVDYGGPLMKGWVYSEYKEDSCGTILSDVETTPPPMVHPDLWFNDEESMSLMSESIDGCEVHCSFDQLECLFTSNSCYSNDSVVKDAFSSSTFQLLQRIWFEKQVPSIQYWYNFHLARIAKIERTEQELLTHLLGRDKKTNITFAFLCVKVPLTIVQNYILPYFNRERYSYHHYRRCLEDAQKEVKHLHWTIKT